MHHTSISTQLENLRPTYVEVNLKRLTENYRAIQAHVGRVLVMPILKANAYGHGLIEVAHHLEQLGIRYFGVAYLEEGILMREAGIQTTILVMGAILAQQIPLFLKHNLTLTASSIKNLKQINETAVQMGVRAKVHLKIDTGMGRIGIQYDRAHKLLRMALACDACEVEGIYSHFANADAADLTHAQLQFERFCEVLHFYERHHLPSPQLRHMANSGAILQLPQAHFDMVRPGILLYGVYPSAEAPRTIPVQPALGWKSRVVYLKAVKPNHPVSYGSTWQSDHTVRILTIPVGYGDGYFRSLSNKASVIIRGRKYPVVGRVCMDQIMVNIEEESAANGDEVLLIGESNGAKITCDDLAEWVGTIPYEVLTNINTRVPRIYVN